MSDTNPSGTLLRRALGANACFSTLTGSASLIAPQAIATFLGAPKAEIMAIGFDLLLFAGFLFFLAFHKDLERPWIRTAVTIIIALDVLWVLGSAATILAPASPLTSAGKWTVFAIAAVVADFAAFQTVGWRRLYRVESQPVPA